MTPDTPRIPVLLDKRRRRIERIAALRAEEVADVPLGPTRHDHFSFNGSLAGLTPRGEEFVVIQVAEKALAFVTILLLEAHHVFVRGVCGQELNVLAPHAGLDAGYALGVFVVGFWVEGDALEMLAAVVAAEALGVEAASCG
jgi:hypothetical protein